MKLNLGGGGHTPDGYVEIDHQSGGEIYPLPFGDGSAEVVRASHCLEHFSHKIVGDVVKEWVRVLKPGGTLKIAVPDFRKIVSWYVQGKNDLPLQLYLMGGQKDEDDYHKTIFEYGLLKTVMEKAGLEDIRPWTSELQDNASYEVSLNLEGTKPGQLEPEPEPVAAVPDRPVNITAVISVPRLGINANWHCTIQALIALGIKVQMVEGVFWGQCLTRGIEAALLDGADVIVTIDYDSVFSTAQLAQLIGLLYDHTEYDCLVPVEMKREAAEVLWQSSGDNDYSKPITPILTGHFGLTVFDARAFANLPKPWFLAQPDEDGGWGEGKIDEDIYFWRNWGKAGMKVGLANDVRIGHLEFMISWCTKDMRIQRQSVNDYRKHGQPENCGGPERKA
jgi:predicted SAM-dependent methyltransferase